MDDIVEFYQKSLNIKETADHFNLSYRNIYRIVNKNKMKKYQSGYLLKNKNKIYQKNKEWYNKNKDIRHQYCKKYYQNNKEKCKQMTANWTLNNKEKVRIRHKNYNQLNKEYINKRTVSYAKNRYKNDPIFKINMRMRYRLWEAIKSQNIKKDFKTGNITNLIGCSPIYLKQYIEFKFQPGMNWDNYGIFGWHIDHIKPCNNFDLTIEEERKKCFHYTNLQPLWASDNLSKGGKYL